VNATGGPGMIGRLRDEPVRSPSRIIKAAQEFEAQLLTTLLEPLEKSFSSVGGKDSTAGDDDYGYMGIQALASALSNSGGIGIADRVARQLARTEVSGRVSGSRSESDGA
jgi:Rod binding domain-containing protein